MKHNQGRVRLNGRAAWLLCALMLIIALAPCATPATRAESGALSVKLPEYVYQQLPANAKATFRLCRIGEPDPASAAGWRIDERLKGYGVLAAQTTSQLNDIAGRMASEAGDRLEGVTQTTVARTATFGELPDGVYLGYMTEGPEGLEVIPFIVTVPVRSRDDGQLLRAYDLTVKATYTPPSAPPPDDTPTPAPTTPAPTTPPPGNTTPPQVTPTPRVTPTPTPTQPPRGGRQPGPTPAPTVEIAGKKIWKDEDDLHHTRPESITVQLFADGTLVNAQPSWTRSGSEWSYSFGRLPAVTDSGREIQYTVREQPVSGYTSSVSGLTITNTLIPRTPSKYIDLRGKKTWADGNNAAGRRPESIVVRLLRDGVEVASRTVAAADGWSYVFEKQPADDGYGNTYAYSVKEDSVPGYFIRVSGMNLINTAIRDDAPEDGPYAPTGVVNRHTGTPVPGFGKLNAQALGDLMELFDYGTPLWGDLLSTGDETPAYPFVFAALGALALAAWLLARARSRRTAKR